MSAENKSVGWVVWMLALAVAFAGWAFLAADFFQNDPAGGAGQTNFFVNAVVQLPNFPKVMSYAFAHRAWAFIVIAVLEAGVLVLGVVMKKLEGEMEGKPKSSAGRRR